MKLTAAMRSLLTLALMVPIGQLAFAQVDASTEPPNIIMVSIDDLGDLTAYTGGNPESYVPNLHRLAAAGVRFTSAHCAAPVCAPSRTAFLTGKSPTSTGIFTNSDYTSRFDASKEFRSVFAGPSGMPIHTLPEWLKDAGGYFTIGMGKVFHGWGYSGFDRDFEESNPDPCSRGLSWSDFRDFGPQEDPVPSGATAPDYFGVRDLPVGPVSDAEEGDMMDTKQVDEAIAFLGDYGSNPGNYCDRPFFLAVGLYRPHEPFFAPARYFSDEWQPDLGLVPYEAPYNNPANAYPPNGSLLAPQPSVPYADFDALSIPGRIVANGFRQHKTFENHYKTLGGLPPLFPGLSDPEKAGVIAQAMRANVTMSYMASVSYVDAQLGRLVDALEADPALAANTVIVVFSDHGFNLGQKKHWLKNALWDQVSRVPFILRDPRQPIGQVVNTPVSLMDVFPTLCDLAGVNPPLTTSGQPYLDGESLVPLLSGQSSQQLRPTITALQTPDQFWFSCYPFYSVHTGGFQGIRYRTPASAGTPCDGTNFEDAWELFDVGETRERDPLEWDNLAEQSAYKGMIAWMDACLPGGDLYGQALPGLDIHLLDHACAPAPGDTLRFVAGSNTTNDPIYAKRWEVPELGTSQIADTFFLAVDSIPESAFTDLAGLAVFLTLVDTADHVINMTVLHVPLGEDLQEVSFTASVQSDGYRVLAEPDDDRVATWDFGDGVRWKGIRPGLHAYTTPGTYTISRTLDNLLGCTIGATESVTIDTAALVGTCLPPYPPAMVDAGPNAVLTDHAPVYGAFKYGLRWRAKQLGQDNWLYAGLESSTQRQLFIGQPITFLEIQTKAFCVGSVASQWSGSAFPKTTQCRAPFDLVTKADTSTATVQWLPLPEAVGGQAFMLHLPDGDTKTYIVGPNDNQLELDSLKPGQIYTVDAASLCRDIGGVPNFASRPVATITFTTSGSNLDSVSVDTLGLRRNIEGQSLRVWPNPSHDGGFSILPHVADQAYGLEQTPLTIRIMDISGQIRHQSLLAPNEMLVVRAGTLPTGTYWVEWVESGLVRQVLVSP